MARVTWDALHAYSKQKCNCQGTWNPAWDDEIQRFAGVGYPTSLARRFFEGDDRDLDIKRRILGIPMRNPNSLR